MPKDNPPTGAQIRAARAFLDWSLKDLADRAGIGISSIQRLEAQNGPPGASETGVEMTRDWRAAKIAESLEKAAKALRQAGITFLNDSGRQGIGVRLK